MAFIYIPQREKWRTAIVLAWKKGDLRTFDSGIMKRIAEYAAPPWPSNPVRKLTVNLIGTYTGINDAYYEAKRKWNGNFTWRAGMVLVLKGRYELKKQIGNGAFGVVMHAVDIQTGENVAIKIIKARPAYTMQAQREIRLLQSLRALDEDKTSNVVELRSHFVYMNHQCLVFEMLSANLYTLLERVHFHGFSLPLVRKFAYQLLVSLQFLASKGVRVIHTDVKPENICIRNSKRSAIKLIDFGSSCQEGQRLFSYIQSRYYRSPEVLLNMDYTVAIDMWSLACVLVEMHVGKPLFSGDCQEDQLLKIMQIKGMPPDSMIDLAPEKVRDRFFKLNRQGGPGKRRWRARKELPPKNLADILGIYTGGPEQRWRNEEGHTLFHYQCFMDMINRMLDYDPETRLKPSEALQHSFIAVPPRPITRQQQQQQQQPKISNLSPQPAPWREGGSVHMSQQHHTELSSALNAIGCPQDQLKGRPLNEESISELLKLFTSLDDVMMGEALRRFNAYVEQRLRSQRDKALKHLVQLFRDYAAELYDDPMAIENTSSSSPAP